MRWCFDTCVLNESYVSARTVTFMRQIRLIGWAWQCESKGTLDGKMYVPIFDGEGYVLFWGNEVIVFGKKQEKKKKKTCEVWPHSLDACEVSSKGVRRENEPALCSPVEDPRVGLIGQTDVILRQQAGQARGQRGAVHPALTGAALIHRRHEDEIAGNQLQLILVLRHVRVHHSQCLRGSDRYRLNRWQLEQLIMCGNVLMRTAVRAV